MPFVYILQCNDGTYYTGYAVDLEKRLQQHQDGIACKYTRGRLPVSLVYREELASKGEAMSREASIKKLTKRQKEKLIESAST
ncbi:MAG: GIY-YIG nuclease family protein [Deltaproteobacteria bacterium]